MARGIVDPDGADLAKRLTSFLHFLAPQSLAAAVEALLVDGAAVDSVDGTLEISFRPAFDGLILLTVRMPGAPVVADLTLKPVGHSSLPPAAEPLPTNPWPCPDRWRAEVRPGVVRWHLFNVEVHGATTRRNDPPG